MALDVKPLTERMEEVLVAMKELERAGDVPSTPNEIALQAGYTEGGIRHGSGAASRGGWSGNMAPANRIIFSLTALERRGLVHVGMRRDGLSGTGYSLSTSGEAWIREREAA